MARNLKSSEDLYRKFSGEEKASPDLAYRYATITGGLRGAMEHFISRVENTLEMCKTKSPERIAEELKSILRALDDYCE